MQSHSLLVPFLALAAAAAAQTPSPMAVPAANPSSLPWPTDRVLTDVVGNTVWATTATWKASFAADGATFVPCLGGDVPSAPVRFALREVHAGSKLLHLGDAAPQLAGQRITQDHGGVREQFDLRQDGVEQSFVFDALPASGAVQLDLGVATGLAHASDANGHTFTDERGGVRYGNAIAFDAAGHRIALETTWTGDTLRLTVPASFVADATLPLTIDPLIGAIANATVVNNVALSSTDIAYDQSLGRYFVCYERAFSATDHDVFVVPLDTSLVPQAIVTIDFTNSYWSKPRIAVLEAHDKVGVVAEQSTGNVSPFVVGMRQFTAGATPVVDAQFVAATAQFNGDALDPDVGGDANVLGPSNFWVVYESKDYAVASVPRGILIDPAGNTVNSVVLGIGIAHHRRLKVSKTCGQIGGGTEGWCVVHRSEVEGAISGKLVAWFVRRNGTLRMPVGGFQYVNVTGPTINLGNDWDVSSPTNQAGGRTFACVERRADLLTGIGSLTGHAFDHVGNLLVSDAPLVSGNYDERMPAIDSDGVRFALVYAERFSATDSDVRMITLAHLGGQLVQQDFSVVSISGDRDDQPAICARTGVPNRYGMAWTHYATNAWSVQSVEYAGTGLGGMSLRTTGCGSITIGYSGSLALGDSFSVTVNHQTGIGIVIAGSFANVPIPGCSGCTLGVDGTAFTGSQLTVPVPNNPALVGSIVSFQGARWDPLGGSCLNMLAFTSTLDVVVK